MLGSRPKLDKKCFQRFGKPNMRSWQILVGNQMLDKIMALPNPWLSKFGGKPNMPLLYSLI
jgi:hypothetical protein